MSTRYTVQPGDTLSGIAAAQLGGAHRWPEIARLTGLADPNLIRVGQVVLLPDGDEAADASASAAATSWGEAWVLELPPGWWVSSPYGPRTLPGYGTHHHDGIDLAIPSGTPLPAMAAGRVSIAGDFGGYGGVVEVITPTGHRYRYAHCRRFLVRQGEQVAAGQLLAESGGAPTDPRHGMSTGAHLHLEVRGFDGAHLDPALVVQVRDQAGVAA